MAEDEQRRFQVMLLIAVCERELDTLDRDDPLHASLIKDLERLIARAREELAPVASRS